MSYLNLGEYGAELVPKSAVGAGACAHSVAAPFRAAAGAHNGSCCCCGSGHATATAKMMMMTMAPRAGPRRRRYSLSDSSSGGGGGGTAASACESGPFSGGSSGGGSSGGGSSTSTSATASDSSSSDTDRLARRHARLAAGAGFGGGCGDSSGNEGDTSSSSSGSTSSSCGKARRHHHHHYLFGAGAVAKAPLASAVPFDLDTCGGATPRTVPPRPEGVRAGPPAEPTPALLRGVARTQHCATTPDGWRLHFDRVVAVDSDAASSAAALPPRRRCPVILCPGLASGGRESFDLDPARSLAQHLAEAGYDVWLPDLRGNGRSDRVTWWSRARWWTVDDHLHLDVPTVVDAVLRATGAEAVHWAGHSMGGMLAVGAISRGLKCAKRLRSLTLLGSGCFGAGSWHSLASGFVKLVTVSGFFAGQIVPVLAALSGPLAPLGWLTRVLFFDATNTPPEDGTRLLRSVLSFIPAGVAAQFVGSLNSELGIASRDGGYRYADPAALARDTTTPVLAINGDRDFFCPPAGALKTVGMFGGKHRRFLALGPAYGTSTAHYSHFDVLTGRAAARGVFPVVSGFMGEFDAAAPAPAVAVAVAAPAAGAVAPTATAALQQDAAVTTAKDNHGLGASGRQQQQQQQDKQQLQQQQQQAAKGKARRLPVLQARRLRAAAAAAPCEAGAGVAAAPVQRIVGGGACA